MSEQDAAYDRVADAIYEARPWPKDEAPDLVNVVQDMAAERDGLVEALREIAAYSIPTDSVDPALAAHFDGMVLQARHALRTAGIEVS